MKFMQNAAGGSSANENKKWKYANMGIWATTRVLLHSTIRAPLEPIWHAWQRLKPAFMLKKKKTW